MTGINISLSDLSRTPHIGGDDRSVSSSESKEKKELKLDLRVVQKAIDYLSDEEMWSNSSTVDTEEIPESTPRITSRSTPLLTQLTPRHEHYRIPALVSPRDEMPDFYRLQQNFKDAKIVDTKRKDSQEKEKETPLSRSHSLQDRFYEKINDSIRHSSDDGQITKTRSRKSSKSKRPESGFYAPLLGIDRASQTESSIKRKISDISSQKSSSSTFLSKKAASIAHQTVGTVHKKEIEENPTADLSNWLGLEISPSYFAFHSKGFTDIVTKLTEIKKEIEELTVKLKKSRSLLNDLKDYQTWKEAKLALKEKKASFQSVLTLLSFGNAEEEISRLQIIISCLKCTSMEEAKTVLALLSLGNEEEEVRLQHVISCLQCKSKEEAKAFLEKIDLKTIDPKHIKFLKPLILEKKDWNEIKLSLEQKKDERKNFVSNTERLKKIELLNLELELLNTLLLSDDFEEAKASIQDDMIELPRKIHTLRKEEKQIREKVRIDFLSDTIKKEAETCLRMNIFPKKPKEPKDYNFYEAVLAEMARQALCLTNQDGKYNDAELINDGSGGVYLIYNKPPDTEGRAPLFVFKPMDEAPGMPGNPRGHTKESLRVVGNRSLIEKPVRLGFPVNQGIFREYALSILGFSPIRSLATLKTAQSKELKSGLLIQFVHHIYTLRELADAVKAENYDKLIKQYQLDIEALKDDKRDEEERTKELNRLNFALEGAKAARGHFSVKEKKSEAQIKAIQLCEGWGKVGDSQSSLSTMPIWNFITQSSLRESVSYSNHLPDFDQNAENTFLIESPSSTKGERSYELVRIDADQTFPDTWQELYPPAWLGSSVCDFVLSEDMELLKSIKEFNAHRLLSIFKYVGIKFQEKEEVIFDIERNEPLVVGGDLFNILNAFHVVAKMGLINGNTANQVGNVLFGVHGWGKSCSRLHGIFLKAKKAEEDGDYSSMEKEEYINIVGLGLYLQCLNTEKLSFWAIFEALVLQELNREKKKSSDKLEKK